MNPSQRIEITHDILAREVYARIDADEKMRLKIGQFLRDRYDYFREAGVLLTKDDLEYVNPYLGVVDLTTEQKAFVTESRRDVAARSRRRALLIGGVVLLLLGAATVSTFLGIRATRSEERTALALLESDSLRVIAEAEKRTALAAKVLADENLLRALRADSATSLALAESERQKGIAFGQRSRAERQARQAQSAALVARAREIYPRDNTVALNLTLAAHRNSPSSETRTFLKQLLGDPLTRFYRKRQLPRRNKRYYRSLSADGHRVLGYERGTVYLFETDTGEEIQSFPGHGFDVWSAKFYYPDPGEGRKEWIGTTSLDAARLWDSATGALIQTFVGHTATVTAMVLSKDGTQVVTASEDRTLRLWRVSDGREVRRFIGHDAPVYSVALSPDERSILSGAKHSDALIWDLATGEITHRLPGHAEVVRRVSFAPDDSYLVTGDNFGNILLWQREEEGGRFRSRPLHKTSQGTNSFRIKTGHASDPGRLLLIDGEAGVKELSTTNGATLSLFPAQNLIVDAVVPPDRSAELVSLSVLGELRFWHRPDTQPIHTFDIPESVVSELVFSPGSRYLYASTQNFQVCRWEVATGRRDRCFELPNRFHHAMDLTPDGKFFVVGTRDGAILYDATDGREVRQFTGGHTRDVISVDISSDGKRLLTGSHDGSARLWNVATGREISTIYQTERNGLLTARFLPGETRAALCTRSDGVLIRSVNETRTLRSLAGGEQVREVGISHALGFLAGPTTSQRSVGVWNVENGSLYRSHALRPNSAGIAALEFSPDDKFLLLVEGTILQPYLYDHRANAVVLELLTSTNRQRNCGAVSLDGRFFAIGTLNGRIDLWRNFFAEWDSGRLWQRAEKLTKEELSAYAIDWSY